MWGDDRWTIFVRTDVSTIHEVATHHPSRCYHLRYNPAPTTEQSIFIALLMYRFRFPKNITNFALEFSAVQSLLCKFAFGVYLFVKWSKTQARNNTLKMDIATNALMVILLSCLMVVQVYGSYIVWRIAQTLDRRYEQKSNSDVEKSSITQNSAPARSSRTVVGSEYQIAIMNRLDGS
ncbi:uncharacterized protein EI90DRAFT_2016975 [Cantharellus anzutake]|uniref:uncharacterized protein n=1 Tax=Cantharellus anzutake TaxID=1750568 RepID=UPI0019078760|nr:uncharacterized protein EI90DRAFT_2016975 [Cantharellus anzutake]KAF8325791.1 hypothetical protein EI90DRAFT_2016975 [Cantharellus anzutake]